MTTDFVAETARTTASAGAAKGMVHGQSGMVKVVTEQSGGQVLGVHLVGRTSSR